MCILWCKENFNHQNYRTISFKVSFSHLNLANVQHFSKANLISVAGYTVTDYKDCDHNQITVTFLTYLLCKQITLKVTFFQKGYGNLIKKDQSDGIQLIIFYAESRCELVCRSCSWTCVNLWTHPRIQWANITYPCLGFALTPQQRSKHNTHRTPRSHRQHNNTSTNNSQQNPPKNQQEQKILLKNWHVYSVPVCVCVCRFSDFIIIIYLSLPPNGARQWGQLVVIYL